MKRSMRFEAFTLVQSVIGELRKLRRRADDLPRRARPASVLILAVTVLVLLALIGTAFISTARIERYSATFNTVNTQVDLLLEGQLNVAQGATAADLNAGNGFRLASSASLVNPPGGSYQTCTSAVSQAYLASRTPIMPAGATMPVWPYISAPSAAGGATFEGIFAVYGGGGQSIPPLAAPVPLPASLLPRYYAVRQNLQPSSIPIQQPDGSWKSYPAFTFMDSPPAGVSPPSPGYQYTNQQITVLAADTDGDGVADAGFVRIPMGQVEGTTYYGAVRIIDNNSAINASVAYGPMDFQGPRAASTLDSPKIFPMATGPYMGTPFEEFWPTNIDLAATIEYATAGKDSVFSLNPFRMQNGGAAMAQPMDDSGVVHTDYAFTSAFEALWTMLGSRLDNPGPNTSLQPSGRYQALPISEGIAMAYRGCLANPSASRTPVLETLLPNSTYSAAVNRAPFAASAADITQWYNTIYAYTPPDGVHYTPPMPLRHVLVARNPVSNFAPSYFPDRGGYVAGQTYQFGDRVLAVDPTTAQLRGFVCIDPSAASAMPPASASSYNSAVWAAMPWTNHPTRINANTATFEQLWTAYWSVMQDSPDANGNYPRTPASGATPTDIGAAQFRSSLRYPGTPPVSLSRSQMIQLRSALAAVNTIDMRDGDDDVTSRSIQLTSADGHVAYATVYGIEKNPYFSELLVECSPKDGQGGTPAVPYVVVDLYNPHFDAINLTGWKLGILKRNNAGGCTLTEVVDLSKTLAGKSNGRYGTPHGPIMVGFEHLVIGSAIASDPTTPLATAFLIDGEFYPCLNSAGGAGNLGACAGNELVLLRPRRADGKYMANVDPANTFNEGSAAQANLTNLVPVDQIDLVGIQDPPAAADNLPHRYRYARASAQTYHIDTSAWHCVYPGPYTLANNVQPDGPFHLNGLVRVGTGVAGDPLPNNGGNVGGDKQKLPYGTSPQNAGAGVYTGMYSTCETRTLVLNFGGIFAGPNRPYLAGSGATGNNNDFVNDPGYATPPAPPFFKTQLMWYPLGGFCWPGSLLDVPFIGSYVISATPPDPTAGTSATVLEMNSVSIDSVMGQFQPPSATDTKLPAALQRYFSPGQDGTYDWDTSFPQQGFHNEQIGHFCPMDVGSTDFQDDPNDPQMQSGVAQQHWTYHWAKRLFDYLTVLSPQDDYIPNVDPSRSPDGTQSGDPTLHNNALNNPKYPGLVPPAPVPNGPVVTTAAGANLGREDTAATEGLVNLNTASLQVLTAIPSQPYQGYSITSSGQFIDEEIPFDAFVAGMIDKYRAALAANPATANFTPFRSLFDLQKVPGFKMLPWIQESMQPWVNSEQGTNPTPVGAFGDVKTRFLMMQQLSNLVTCQSDSFTVYVQVQGWQGIGTASPNLVATRRAAVLLDRSKVRPSHTAQGTTTLTPMGRVTVPND